MHFTLVEVALLHSSDSELSCSPFEGDDHDVVIVGVGGLSRPWIKSDSRHRFGRIVLKGRSGYTLNGRPISEVKGWCLSGSPGTPEDCQQERETEDGAKVQSCLEVEWGLSLWKARVPREL